MKAGIPSSDLVHLACSLLKQDTYYDKMDLFLRVNAAAYKASDPFQKRQDALATIVDGLHRGPPSPKSRKAINGLQERDYAIIISVIRKIPNKILEENQKLLMCYDQAVTRAGGET